MDKYLSEVLQAKQLVYVQCICIFNMMSVLDTLHSEFWVLVEQNIDLILSSGPWECNIELCEDRSMQVNPQMLERLSLAFVDCHCKGKANWGLIECKD
jgi:hypothetical protein